MLRFFNRVFNIRTAEWPRVLLLSLMHFLVNGGVIWTLIITEASFLKFVGVNYLSWVFIASPVVSILAIAAYTAFADRVSNTTLLIAILIVSSLGFGGGRMLMQAGFTVAAYAVWYPLTLIFIDIFFSLHWGTYVNGFYDTQAAKRIFPIVASSARIAAIVAGATIAPLNRLLPEDIMLIWIGLLLAVALLAGLMPRILGERPSDRSAAARLIRPKQKTASYISNIRAGLRYVVGSPFLRWMALGTFSIYLLFALFNYQAGLIFVRELQSIQAISSWTGLINSIGNLVMFPILLFGLSRLIGWMGVGNASLIFPAGTLAISGSLIAAPSIYSGGLAYFDRTSFRVTFYTTFDSLLYNAVPLRVKARARAFITGLVIPLGTLAGGLLLLAIPAIPFAGTWLLPTLTGGLTIGYIGCAFMIRREYSSALVTMLRQEDFSFLMAEEVGDLRVSDAATLNSLKQKLAESKSYESTIFTAKLLIQIGGRATLPIIEQAVRTAPDGRTRAALIDILVAGEARWPGIEQLYRELVSDPLPQVRQAAIAGLEQVLGFDNEAFLTLALEILQDPDIEVRSQVLPALTRSSDFIYLAPAVQELNQFLADADPRRRMRAVRVLGNIGDVRIIRSLLRYLADPADEVRLEAVMVIETLAQGQGTIQPWMNALVLNQMRTLVHDPIERVRQATLGILGHIATTETHVVLVSALNDTSPQVRATAVEALTRVGRGAIPAVHPLLNAPDPQVRKMAGVVLSRLDRATFGGLVQAQIVGNLIAIYRNQGRLVALEPCTAYRGVAVLRSALSEQCRTLADEILYLLGATGGREVVIVIGDTLRSSEARVRANAAEALETLTSPQTARLIAPLFDPDTPVERLLHIGRESWDLQPPDTAQALHQVLDDPAEPWMRTIAAFAIGEMYAVIAPPPPPPAVAPAPVSAPPPPPSDAPAPRKRDGRAKLAGLLDTLGTEQPPPAESPPAAGPPPPADEAAPPPSDTPPARRRDGRAKLAGLLDALSEEAPATAPKSNGVVPTPSEAPPPPPPAPLPFDRGTLTALVEQLRTDAAPEVRIAVEAATRGGRMHRPTQHTPEETNVLSTIERIMFLKEVPFFHGMTVDQLRVLATVCEERLFTAEQRMYSPGEAGGTLYVVVSGRVGIEQEKRKGSFARIATVEAYSYFGESNLFDNSPHQTAAIALQDTLTLRLRREPLTALARQYPDLSLELINVLSQRLREANDRIADLTRTKPRELQRLYDQFE